MKNDESNDNRTTIERQSNDKANDAPSDTDFRFYLPSVRVKETIYARIGFFFS
ncbi:hypothetical protein APL35_gp224 [Apis mellifera filamentous virus]|uniref:hypothetical protein n=1 Tax=Apis mellifera filamentous virus TaxID=1100043 RepID=UPI0006BCAE54|nr:hypothetical protein APL35_gp224 [Apis mellifera filamentous virus]